MRKASIGLISLLSPFLLLNAEEGQRPVTAKPKLSLPEKWVHTSHNFAHKKNCDEIVEMLGRAAKAGYTGIAITDCKFHRWKEVQRPDYDNNLRRVRQACRDLKLRLIAICCGMSTDLRWTWTK